MYPDKCFACDRPLGHHSGYAVDTRDDQVVLVGYSCYRAVMSAGEAGYQPPKGGPKLYPLPPLRDYIPTKLRRQT